MIEGFESISNC